MAYKEGYGKKNWLKWLLIYAVIGGLVYALIYYFFLNGNSSTPYSY
jgi:hypothetical protein